MLALGVSARRFFDTAGRLMYLEAVVLEQFALASKDRP